MDLKVVDGKIEMTIPATKQFLDLDMAKKMRENLLRDKEHAEERLDEINTRLKQLEAVMPKEALEEEKLDG